MKKKCKAIVSLMLSAVMAASLSAVGAISLGAEAASGRIIVTTTPTIEESSVSSGTSAPETEAEPIIMDFSSVAAMNRTKTMFYKHDGNEEGQQKMIVNSGDDNSVQLLYSPGTGWSPYRAMIKFQSANLITPEYKYARLTYKVVDNTAGTITLTNNGGGGTITIVANTSENGGEWVTTNVFDISACDILKRFIDFKHATLQYTSTNPDAKVYIKELAFFTSEQQAYDYYGDEYSETSVSYSTLSFGSAGNAGFLKGDTYGVYTINEADATLDITYAEKTNIFETGYLAKIKFLGGYDINNTFIRVLYAAKNPDGIDSVNMYLFHDGKGDNVMVAKDIVDTNGSFVLSDTFSLGVNMPDRFATNMHCSLYTDTNAPGGEYRIKALYFFPTRAAADSFKLSGGDTVLTINGNNIENYKIVVSENASDDVASAAGNLQAQLKAVSGVTVPIINDSEPQSEYEILVGKSSRELSYKKLDELQNIKYDPSLYLTGIDGKTLYISTEIPYALPIAMESFLRTHLYLGLNSYPEAIDLTDEVYFEGAATGAAYYDWEEPENVSNPIRFKDNFSIDDGYWQEENNTSDWMFKNGTYTTSAKDLALSYLHVYEHNVKFGAKLMYSDAGEGASAGLMLRYNAEDAYVKAGYDFDLGEWYIESREGKDFYLNRVATAKASVTPNTWYDLSFTVDGSSAYLYVNGQLVLTTNKASHTSPGRIAVYAENVTVAIDDANITLLSGEGTIMKDIVHTKLPDDKYMEGGSVWEMSDGSLTYMHNSGITYKSLDNGLTWQSAEKWTDPMGYPNIMRLNNGDFMRIASVGGFWISQTSSDDGKTWVNGGTICSTKMGTAGAGNMNDKLFQSGTNDRIFYSQNYEAPATAPVDGRNVFCEFYYSDDNGKTWTKSETDSWEIVGNETTKYFGECKLLECADGTIRMYNSWSTHGCITYSDSTDGGKTFGPLVRMEDFPTSRSSMQFVRDPYGPTDTTYYMVWVNNEPIPGGAMPRSRLSLAYSTDGKNWEILGDIWRWESNFMVGGSHINHIVDPFVKVTENYVLVGSGFSEYSGNSGVAYHHEQRQHIYSVKKSSLHPEKLGEFTDVTTANSYYDAVKFAVENKLFNGTSATTFEPATEMTRAMFVTVLGRLDGADVSKYATPTFNDVKAGEWYTSYVEWAAANSIVNGIGNGLYGINGEITVEQACTILFRYANGKTATVVGDATSLTDFADSASVSSWAADGVKWAVENGIYEGQGTLLNPSAAASRALVATMFANYVKAFG